MKQEEQNNSRKGRLITMLFKWGFVLIFVLSIVGFFPYINIIPARFANADFETFTLFFVGLILLGINIAYFAWQILLVHQYKPYPTPTDEQLPTIGVIVPAFNEGQQVFETLKSLLASDYPKDKLEIITVNDGSKDDTWNWMYASVEKSGGRIIAMDLPRNAGKRNALYKGLLVSTADIIVTLDSDSIVTKETIREIAAPFVADPTIGGVAGNIRVLNTKSRIIPKMLDVSFVFGFEFLRSAQSMVRAVLCTPGALSAYRRKALLPYMDEWVNEKFFGKPANIGEDRAITNILIREGWGVVFQRTATVFTEMPVTYKGLCKMMIRWSRSNVRENFSMSKFAFRKLDGEDDDLTGMQINLIVQIFWMISPIIFTFYVFWCVFHEAVNFLIGISVSIILWSTLPAFIYARRYSAKESLWSYVYGFFSFLTLFWISPYSLITVYQSGWLTRQQPKAPTPLPSPGTSGPGTGK